MNTKTKNNQILAIMLFYSLASILTAVATASSIEEALSGLLTIVQSPAQLTMDYFKLGTVGGTFLNVGLVGLACTIVFRCSGFALNGGSLMAFFLTIGFSFFGMNILNIWPCILGTWLYTRIMKVPFSSQVNVAIFSTALSPFVSEGIWRYPAFEASPAKEVLGVLLGIMLGLVAGFLMPILCQHSPNLHKGYSLYNAAAVAGFIGILLFSVLFEAMGNEIPFNTDIGESYDVVVNAFALVTSLLCLLAGFILNGNSFKGYGAVVQSTGYQCDFIQRDGVPLTLLNIGVFGIFCTTYYNVVGAAMTGPTAGSIVCLLAIAPCGAHVFNVLPIMLGYWAASTICAFHLHTQAIVVGLCFAGALSPISGRFGNLAGAVAGAMHACTVTTVVTFHGGFCLYNGGFTAGITAMILVPVLEHFFAPQDRLSLLPARKKPLP